MIELAAFLGNYGKEYEKTRHNTAWLFADSLPFAQKLNWQNKFKAEYASMDTTELALALEQSGLLKRRSDSSLPVPEGAPSAAFPAPPGRRPGSWIFFFSAEDYTGFSFRLQPC